MKLSKSDLTERDRLTKALDDAGGNLRQAVEEFNRTKDAAWAIFEDHLRRFNEDVRIAWEKLDETRASFETIREEAVEFAARVGSDAQSEFDDRSERWQEGDAGQQLQEFISQWEAVRDGPLGTDVDLAPPEGFDLDADGLDVPELEDLDEFDPTEIVQALEAAPADSREA